MRALLALAFAAIATVATTSPAYAAEAARPPAITVSVDMRALSPETSQRIDALTLESRVVLRLIEEGFAVAASWSEPDVRVVVEEKDGAVLMGATGAGEEERGKVTLGAGTASELQLEIAQKIVELCRGRVRAVEQAREKANAPGPLRKPPPPDEVLPPPPEPLFVALSLGGGALARWFAIDPQVAATVALMTPRRAGVALMVAYDQANGPDLRNHELQLMVGPRVRFLDTARLEIDVGLAVGVVGRAFIYSGPTDQEDQNEGTQLDMVGSVPMAIRFKLGRTFRIGLELAPGYGAAVIHAANGETFFERGDVRLESRLMGSVVF